MLYKEWVDFVVYASNTDKVNTREERLNVKDAVPEMKRDGEIEKRFGLLVSWSDFGFQGDRFEAMWIDDRGNVYIWTEKRVWSIHRRIDNKEKLTYLPRNPDLELLF